MKFNDYNNFLTYRFFISDNVTLGHKIIIILSDSVLIRIMGI